MSRYPDIEAALLDLQAPLVPAGHTGTVAPSGLASLLPFIRVNRFGGGDNGVTDVATIDIDWFAKTRTAVFDLAADAHQIVINSPHRVGNIILDLVETQVGPHEIPWDDKDVRRYSATYYVSARRLR